MNKPIPMAKAHPASELLKAQQDERDERLERVKDLTGAETAGFLPIKPCASAIDCPHTSECSRAGKCIKCSL